VETDPTRMCELLVGLPDVSVLGVEEGDIVVVHVELRTVTVGCPSCGVVAWVKDRSAVELVDLPAFGARPAGVAQARLALPRPGLSGELVHRPGRSHRPSPLGDDGPGGSVGHEAGGAARTHRGRGGR
jgi:hypothetical protein